MPLFHFHVRDGRDWPDEDGTELASKDQARIEALRHAGDMLKDSAAGGPFAKEWQMRVTNDQDRMLFRLDFTLTEASEARPDTT